MKKNRDRRGQGARERSYNSVAGTNYATDARYKMPGMTGHGGLGEISKGMFEGKETIYNDPFLDEENMIHLTKWELNTLIEHMEKTKNEA